MVREGGPPIDLSQSTDDERNDRPSGPPAARRAGSGIEVIEIDDSSSEDGQPGSRASPAGRSRLGTGGSARGRRGRGDSLSSVDSLENLSQFRRPGRRGGDAKATSEAATPPAAPSPDGASPRKRYDWIEAWMPAEGAGKPDAPDEGGGDERPGPDPPAPKIPGSWTTSFGLYADATRPAVLAANPGSDGGEADRILAAMFESLPADQRKMWQEMAQ